MTEKMPMTPDDEYDYYSQPDNQEPQGPARRRQPRLSEMVPVRFAPELLDQIRRRAEADDRSLSSWIRRAPNTHSATPRSPRTARKRIQPRDDVTPRPARLGGSLDLEQSSVNTDVRFH